MRSNRVLSSLMPSSWAKWVSARKLLPSPLKTIPFSKSILASKVTNRILLPEKWILTWRKSIFQYNIKVQFTKKGGYKTRKYRANWKKHVNSRLGDLPNTCKIHATSKLRVLSIWLFCVFYGCICVFHNLPKTRKRSKIEVAKFTTYIHESRNLDFACFFQIG